MQKSLVKKFFCVLLFICFHTIDVKTFECGTTDFDEGLITKGTRSERGEWPFLTALYLIEELKFFCGGSIISAKHVLTAGHCIQEKDSRLRLFPADIFVRLGAYDLTLSNDTEVLERNVSEIYVHPDWDIYEMRYDADLAILSLYEPVLYTNYIRQVCMPSDNTDIDGASGSVAGWGLTENRGGQSLAFTKHAFVRVLNDTYCYTNDSFFAAISSNRTFCGQAEDGSPNLGDSGGGFFIRLGFMWVQYGIVSVFKSDATGYVDPNSIAVYTNVIAFKTWIAEIVTESGGAIEEAKIMVNKKIDLKCRYGYFVDNDESYGCWLDDLDLRDANFEVASFTGFHGYPKESQDVQLIHFHNGTMFFLPTGIGKFFTNLRHFEINEGLRTKFIRRSQLKNLEYLVGLRVSKNEVDRLDKYALWDLPNLEEFTFTENNLNEINEKTFEKNLKLRIISLQSNTLSVLPRNLFKNNSVLEMVDLRHNYLKVIDESIFATNLQLVAIDLRSNQLQTLPKNLLKNNPLLRVVNLGDNLIKEIDEEVFLNSNQLEVLSRNILKNNPLLEYLNLGKNFIKIIDEDFFQNNSLLKLIFLLQNSLKFINESTFATNGKLSLIDLSSNQLEALPSNLLKNNRLLKAVSFNDNSIKEIDVDLFQNNFILEPVTLGGNSLNVINESVFTSNGNLRTIDLGRNRFETLPRDLFKNNLLLESVILLHNSIKVIDENIFATNEKLKRVYLSSNQLEVLPPYLFEKNLLLENVALEHNIIKVINKSTFETNEKLEIVDLAFNKIEVLPSNLFQNNFLLMRLLFRHNLLSVIEIDFINFKNIAQIDFYDNVCIDASYGYGSKNRNVIKSLTEFQSLIRVNCSIESLIVLTS